MVTTTTTTTTTTQQQQQHFISPHNVQEIKIYNNSTDDDGDLWLFKCCDF